MNRALVLTGPLSPVQAERLRLERAALVDANAMLKQAIWHAERDREGIARLLRINAATRMKDADWHRKMRDVPVGDV